MSFEVFHIGTSAIDQNGIKRETKAIGGIQGYISDLIYYTLSQNINVSLIGKMFDYQEKRNFVYFPIKQKFDNNIKFLILLMFKSIFIKIPKKALIHAHRPDHLAAFTFFKKAKSIITLHGQQKHTVKIRNKRVVRIIYNFLERIAMNKASVLIAVDEVTKEFYYKLYPKYANKIYLIPTGVNTSVFYSTDKSSERKKFGFSENDKIVVYVGRIGLPKKVDMIIRAFSILVVRSKNYKLVIVGDGDALNDNLNLVKKLQLDENVFFLGARNRTELPQIYNMANISVLYSGNEGSPLSVKESLACGIPVVANCVGDIPKIIINGYNGYLTEKDSIEDLSEKMIMAIDQSNKMKNNCIQSISNYSINKVCKKVIEIYKHVISE